jgi:hypothetical protein
MSFVVNLIKIKLDNIEVGRGNNVWGFLKYDVYQGKVAGILGKQQSLDWVKCPQQRPDNKNGEIIGVSVGIDGTVIILTTKKFLHAFEDGKWVEDTERTFAKVAVASKDQVWAIGMDDNKIYRRKLPAIPGPRWTPGPALPENNIPILIACAADGTVWVTTKTNRVFRYNGSGWDEIGYVQTKTTPSQYLNSAPQYLSVGSSTSIYLTVEDKLHKYSKGGWEEVGDMPAHPKNASVGDDGLLWVVDNYSGVHNGYA